MMLRICKYTRRKRQLALYYIAEVGRVTTPGMVECRQSAALDQAGSFLM